MSEVGDIVNFISKAAPFIGGLFGPAGSIVGNLAGKGLEVAAEALGCEPSQQAVGTAIMSDPDAALKLQKYEMDNKIDIIKQNAAVLGVILTDVQDARKNLTEREKITGKVDKNLVILMWMIVLGFFASLLTLQFFPANSNPNAPLLLGTLAAAFGAVVQFNFGTTKSSDAHVDMIYNSTPIKKDE